MDNIYYQILSFIYYLGKYNTLILDKTKKQHVSSIVSIYLTRVYYLKQ